MAPTTRARRESAGIYKLIIKTKKELAAMSRPIDSRFQDIPVKVRRSLVRRAASYGPGAFPIFFKSPTTLSPLYDKHLPDPYIDQIFKTVRKVGQGCFGDVFRAVSKEDSKLYAIKVTNDTHAFLDLGEVRRLEKIPVHKNCVTYYLAWQESYRLYIQMELCMISLDKLILVDHFIHEPQCWDILTDISEGLQHLHSRDLIHLDLKPANIMITEDGVCKLGDFGLLVDLTEVHPETLKRKRTGVSVSEGDGKYVAIEVLRENTYTKAGDIFSLGLMMLEVASDVALPTSGTEWEDLRAGVLPDCYLRRKLTRNFRELLKSMILVDHTARPSIDDILRNKAVIKVLANREKGQRKNYVADWEQRWRYYVDTHPILPNQDLPTVQFEGPSPPRRTYPIHYVPPRSPQVIPLRELNYGFDEAGPSRFPRASNISRRLFS